MSQSRAEQFYAEYTKTEKSRIPDKALYDEIINFLVGIETERLRDPHTYINWRNRYSVSENEGHSVIFCGNKRVVFYEELFDVLNKSHTESTGHGGRDAMRNDLKGCRIGTNAIEVYLKHCLECEKKKAKIPKSVVIKPICSDKPTTQMKRSNNPNEWVQISLIDMQAKSDGEFRWIFIYHDYLTKFCILRPLRSKSAEEVVYHLDRIWAEHGPPLILQSDNGREFRNSKVEALAAEWNVNIVDDTSRKRSIHGSTVRCNQDVEDILITFQSYNKTSNWSENLHRFQARKNNRFHSGIGMTPFEAFYGHKIASLPRAYDSDEED